MSSLLSIPDLACGFGHNRVMFFELLVCRLSFTVPNLVSFAHPECLTLPAIPAAVAGNLRRNVAWPLLIPGVSGSDILADTEPEEGRWTVCEKTVV